MVDPAIQELLITADLIPYDVQRLAHELWDDAELRGTPMLDVEDVRRVTRRLVASQAQYYERLWEQLTSRQRALLQALAERGAEALYSESVRREHGLGPASTVQKALKSLDAQDIIDRYEDRYFFLDPLFAVWIRERLT
jgi:nucleotide-binding universal stress UspA family protein